MKTISISFLREKISRLTSLVIPLNGLKPSAVLMLFVDSDEGLRLLFTKRTETIEHHKGQISFPGGRSDSSDTSPMDTALRETMEEIGLPPEKIEILGNIGDFITPTGFMVTAVLGYLPFLPPLSPNPSEVSEIFSVPLASFFDPSLMTTEIMNRLGKETEVYFFNVWKEPVWGITALFIKRLIDILTE